MPQRHQRQQPDDATIARLLGEDAEVGLRHLLAVYGGRVRAYIRKRFGGVLSGDQIDEALNDATFRMWNSFEPSKGKLGAWFVLMAYQASVDLLRRERRDQPRLASIEDMNLDPVAPSEDSPSEDSSSGEFRQELVLALHSALRGLSERERTIIQADLDSDGKASTSQLAEALQTQPSCISRSRATRIENFASYFRPFRAEASHECQN